MATPSHAASPCGAILVSTGGTASNCLQLSHCCHHCCSFVHY